MHRAESVTAVYQAQPTSVFEGQRLSTALVRDEREASPVGPIHCALRQGVELCRSALCAQRMSRFTLSPMRAGGRVFGSLRPISKTRGGPPSPHTKEPFT